MTVDILTGDIFVVGSSEYPVRKVNLWTLDNANSISFNGMLTVTASTKRSPAEDDDDFIGPPAENLTGLSCLPLSPVGDDLVEALGLNTAKAYYRTFVADADGFVDLFLEDPE